MLKKIILVLSAIVLLLLVSANFVPTNYTVSRELAIKASAEKIFPYINNAKSMDSWNPWMEIDPKSKVTFSGPEEGVGATTSWSGGDKLGTGKCTITESITNKIVRSKLEYTEPFVMTQDAEISLAENEGLTTVRWSVSGERTYLCKLMSLFMNMDKMIGDTFMHGLVKLKSIVE